VLGNYFKDMKPNYYIGIRTPWTLKDERVWYNTHKLGSKVWIFGGLALLLGFIFISKEKVFLPIFLVTLLTIVFIPIIYSYIDFKRGK
jgi:Predicted integral membrane protein